MTFKRSVALAALLALGLSSTTGFAKRNPEEPLTESQMLSGTAWTAVKFFALQQYFAKVSPTFETRLNALDSSNGQATRLVADALVASIFLKSVKEYFENVGEYVWVSVGAPIANQLPEPLRSILNN
ncbi:MAG: hypothetical protein AB7F19_07185 [Candidatus Babeliales bacterium]